MNIKVLIYLLLTNYCLSIHGIAEQYDVIVVGGGVAGTYSTWRLSDHDKSKKICLLESSNRIGGRLFSMILPNAPELCAEIGGMRFLSLQENVNGLVRHLGLTPTFFTNSTTENIIYLRRVHLKSKDFKDNQAKVPYNFREDEKGKTSNEMLMMALNKAFPKIATMTQAEVREYLKNEKYQGTPIWKWGFWNLLMNELSIEAYNFIRAAGGYDTELSNWNAYNAIVSYSKYNANIEFFKLKEGFDALPKKMAELFVKNGGALNLNTRVTSLKQVEVNGEKLIEVFYKGAEGEGSHYAKSVILALPKRSIELLHCDSFIFSDPQFVEDLKRVDHAHASKVFLWYDEEWWTKLGFTGGPSRTDLPMRQCYYFGTEAIPNSKASKGLLMASYNDGSSVDFWEGYYSHSSFDRVMETFESKEKFISTHVLPEKMITELTSELSELHEIKVPRPSIALFQNWNDDPFGGGWHMWNPNNQSWKVMPRIRHPIAGVNLYICGEAYSENQGWVEGALQTSEKMLEDYFGLKRPSWISAEYSLGD